MAFGGEVGSIIVDLEMLQEQVDELAPKIEHDEDHNTPHCFSFAPASLPRTGYTMYEISKDLQAVKIKLLAMFGEEVMLGEECASEKHDLNKVTEHAKLVKSYLDNAREIIGKIEAGPDEIIQLLPFTAELEYGKIFSKEELEEYIKVELSEIKVEGYTTSVKELTEDGLCVGFELILTKETDKAS